MNGGHLIRNSRLEPGYGSRGVTLIELLAALLISAIVVAVAGRIFLSGHAQFMKRSADSAKLGSFYRSKRIVEAALKSEVVRCEGGRLWLRRNGVESELEAEVKKHDRAVKDAEFRCLEAAADGATLQPWKDGAQPRLVEYRLRFKTGGDVDSLSGSFLP